MYYLHLSSVEPAFNLALEEHLHTSLPVGHPGLFLLWQNRPSVIVGRHQCTSEEINAAFVEQEHIPVVRRMTGGGAVYHDGGNLNFSFIVHAPQQKRVDLQQFMRPICAALAELGVAAELSGRNDLEVQGRKISGSSQRLYKGRVLHHGTLLVNADFDRLTQALKVDAAKISSKGVASVRARVANLAEFWPQGTTLTDLKACLARHCAEKEISLSPQDAAAAEKLAAEKYRQWNWNYGASPPFTQEKKQRFPWGQVCWRLEVRQGRIRACRIYGDFFASADVAELEHLLTGLPCEAQAVREALAAVLWPAYFSGCDAEVMREFFRP